VLVLLTKPTSPRPSHAIFVHRQGYQEVLPQLLPLRGRRDPDRPTDFFFPFSSSSRLLHLCPISSHVISSHPPRPISSCRCRRYGLLFRFVLSLSSLSFSRIANAIFDYTGRPLGLVDSSCTWTSWFDVGQLVYGIAFLCISDIPTLQGIDPTVAGERDAVMSDVCCVTV